MAIDAEELVINPFKEVEERGREAVSNAEAARNDDPELAKQMSKAGQAIAREGERALKRLQPLWEAHVEKYGDPFKESIRQNDEIAEKRRVVEDLLYDFEDFIEVDSFEADKFAQLQAATKSFALDTLDIIKRLKIEDPKSAPASPASHVFPPLPPLPPLPTPKRTATQSSRGSRADTRQGSLTEPNVDYIRSPGQHSSLAGETPPHMLLGDAGVRSSAGSAGNRLSGVYRTGTTSSRTSSVHTADGQQPQFFRRGDSWTSTGAGLPRQLPRQALEPLQDPLRPASSLSQPSSTHTSTTPTMTKSSLQERRPSSPDVFGDELPRPPLVTNAKLPMAPAPYPSPPASDGHGSAAPSRITAWVSDQNDHAALPSQQQIHEPQYPGQQRYRFLSRDGSIQEQLALASDSGFAYGQSPRNGFSFPYHGRRYDQNQREENHMSGGSLFDPTSPAITNRTSLFSDATTASSAGYGVAITASDPRMVPLGGFNTEKETGSPPSAGVAYTGGIPSLPPVGEHDDGLMLAEESMTVSDASGTQVNHSVSTDAGCMIGPKSTFHQLKGFCNGADLFRKSDMVQGLKVAQAYGESTPVSRCTSCEYYHINKEAKLDLEKDSRANFMKAGIVYRLRFLYKSHMTSKNLSEIRYACLFCTQKGHTSRDGDATVFQSPEALLRHLSRHSQPLPRVPGLTVLYGKVTPGSDVEEDYDVHFPDAPAASPVPETAFGMLPAATALKGHISRYGEKPLADPDGGSEVLRFLVGARIVGIEFPEKWGGKWCVGWHDGVKSSFPLKLVELEAPRQSEVSLQGSNTIMAKARWKWNPKDPGRTGWLVFDKGDVIQNIGWAYQDHWCWSGTNSKGKFGVFPSAFMDPNSVRMGQEVKRPTTSKGGGFFGMRRRSISTESSIS